MNVPSLTQFIYNYAQKKSIGAFIASSRVIATLCEEGGFKYLENVEYIEITGDITVHHDPDMPENDLTEVRTFYRDGVILL